MNVLDFKAKKDSQTKISMVTCYDHWSAKIINETDIDCVLVGDSLAQVMHGYSSTLGATVEMIALHTEAVVKGAPTKFVIADLPFLSYRKDLKTNVESVEKLMRAGAQAVKLEGAEGNLDFIHHLVQSGVPVMGHLGLTPQFVHQMGGYKVQGKSESQGDIIFEQALGLQKAGCFSVVFECVPAALAKKITQELKIPTIGIGAGVDTDGQVLVLQDLLGLNTGFQAKFVKKYMQGAELIKSALNDYHLEVSTQKFPTAKESY